MEEKGVARSIAKRLMDHELAHYWQDPERKGNFGFVLSPGWVVAYYLVIGERDPDIWMDIASGPGFADMSPQDQKIYNAAFKEWLNMLTNEDEQEDNREGGDIYSADLEGDQPSLDSRTDYWVAFIDLVAEKLNEYFGDDEFLSIDELKEGGIIKVFEEHPDKVEDAVKHAVSILVPIAEEKETENEEVVI
jgi:hypothetical protein